MRLNPSKEKCLDPSCERFVLALCMVVVVVENVDVAEEGEEKAFTSWHCTGFERGHQKWNRDRK